MRASKRLLGRLLHSTPWRVPTRRISTTRRATVSDTDEREQLIPLIISKLRQGEVGDTVGALDAKMADILVSSAEELVPIHIQKPPIQEWLERVAIRMKVEQPWSQGERITLMVRIGPRDDLTWYTL